LGDVSLKSEGRAARAGGGRNGKRRGLRIRIERRWLRALVYAGGAVALAAALAVTYYYVSFARIVDARLHGERERTLPRVYARPVELRRGQTITEQDLVARLNDLGYTHRAKAELPGEFAIGRNAIAITPRSGDLKGRVVRVEFNPAPAVRRAGRPAPEPTGVRALQVIGRGPADALQLDTPLLTALMTAGREKRRRVPLSTIPKRMQQAVIAIEDQHFYSHPGLNPISAIKAFILTGLPRDGRRPRGGSTITQQLSRMFFLADEFNAELQSGTWSPARKAQEILMSLALERRASKDEILEMYLNEVYLGQRGSFAIHGVAEASRLFFGKDVSNLSVSEAALIAGVIQSPGSLSPFARPQRAIERRNVVLGAMASEGYVTAEAAERASREPLQVVARAVDNEAPYFVDVVGQKLAEDFPGVTAQSGAVDVYTTLDINMQRIAVEAMRTGLASVDKILSRRRRKPPPAQAALIAADPRTGEILAMVGGRSYNQSQYNRAVVSRRQPGSTFKPFVYLAAFERAAEESRSDLTPASMTIDEPQTFTFDDQVWSPGNYEQEYDGEITWRRALAMSRNLGTIHVGEAAGFDRVAALWRKVGVGTPPQGFPSITLGVFELTPLEVAQAYTLFTNGGFVRPLRAINRIVTPEKELHPKHPQLREIARPDTTFLVTHMMRSVLNEGTGAGARGNGFTLEAAGKSGTTNDLRDAWFVGFTPELLTVVWVGFDDNRPLGLSGTQAALPIWTEFMKHALAGHKSVPFEPPGGISFVQIDRDTGKLAQPGCPRLYEEAFLAGTEPLEICELHRW
jgi:penicillin-binding protein 1B